MGELILAESATPAIFTVLAAVEAGAQLDCRAVALTARPDLFGGQGVHYLSFISTPPRPRATSTVFDAKARYTCTPFWFFISTRIISAVAYQRRRQWH